MEVQEKMVVGYWEFIPMELGADNSSEQDTVTVNKELEEPSAGIFGIRRRTVQGKIKLWTDRGIQR